MVSRRMIAALTGVCFSSAAGKAMAAGNATIEKAGMGVAVALPLIAGGIALSSTTMSAWCS
jgi:hypothetical protein